MPPRKRKTAEKQPTLEEVTDQPVKVVTSTKTEHAMTSKKQKTTVGIDAKQQESKNDLFLKRRAKKTGVAEDPAPKTQHEAEPQKDKAIGSEAGIWINRAPTLTLWVSIVARQQGFSKEAGLTFGKTIAGILAHSKGRSIGIYEDHDKSEAEVQEKKEKEEAMGVERADVFGMKIKTLKDQDGNDVRALDSDDQAVDPSKVQSYLTRAFGTRLPDAERALTALAESYSDADELAKEAYNLYSEFRPQIQTGQSGWGQKGLLDLQHIKQLHKK